MSADNWSLCPRCKRDAQEKKEALAIEVQSSYGVKPVEEWLALKSKLGNYSYPTSDDYTLREDYSLGIRDGEFVVSYNANCICGFSFEYCHRERIGE